VATISGTLVTGNRTIVTSPNGVALANGAVNLLVGRVLEDCPHGLAELRGVAKDQWRVREGLVSRRRTIAEGCGAGSGVGSGSTSGSPHAGAPMGTRI
jgi:hypothetical protein